MSFFLLVFLFFFFFLRVGCRSFRQNLPGTRLLLYGASRFSFFFFHSCARNKQKKLNKGDEVLHAPKSSHQGSFGADCNAEPPIRNARATLCNRDVYVFPRRSFLCFRSRELFVSTLSPLPLVDAIPRQVPFEPLPRGHSRDSLDRRRRLPATHSAESRSRENRNSCETGKSRERTKQFDEEHSLNVERRA